MRKTIYDETTPGGRIRIFAREKYNNNISSLARKMGVTRQALSDYLTNKTKPGNKLLAKLELAGCNPSWILYGKGPMIANENEEPEAAPAPTPKPAPAPVPEKKVRVKVEAEPKKVVEEQPKAKLAPKKEMEIDPSVASIAKVNTISVDEKLYNEMKTRISQLEKRNSELEGMVQGLKYAIEQFTS